MAEKKILVAATRRETKTSSKAGAANKKLEKTKSMPAAAVDVILGRAETPIKSVKELSRKMEEDARACGRTPRKITCPEK